MITKEAIEAAIERSKTVNTQGFLYGDRHVLRDIEAERTAKTDVVIWEMTTDDYEVGHSEMLAEAERHYIRAILTAAFAAMPGPAVKVKPLVWVLYRTKGYWCANTTAGRYIAWEIEDGALFCWNPEANSSDTVYRSLQAAKAAAQADYEARILSAITPAPDLASENERPAIPKHVVAELYKFFHDAWEGTGRVRGDGTFGEELLLWREKMSRYHRQASEPAPAIASHIEEARKISDAWALYGREKPCAEVIAAALAAAEERGRMEELERCSAAVPITTGMRELRVSLIARAVRQSLQNYGHKVAESTLPECVAADVERTLVADEKAWEAAPAKPPRDCGINGGDLLESRDNIGSAYTRSTTPPAITKEPTP